jgi:hypothetical protein
MKSVHYQDFRQFKTDITQLLSHGWYENNCACAFSHKQHFFLDEQDYNRIITNLKQKR